MAQKRQYILDLEPSTCSSVPLTARHFLHQWRTCAAFADSIVLPHYERRILVLSFFVHAHIIEAVLQGTAKLTFCGALYIIWPATYLVAAVQMSLGIVTGLAESKSPMDEFGVYACLVVLLAESAVITTNQHVRVWSTAGAQRIITSDEMASRCALLTICEAQL